MNRKRLPLGFEHLPTGVHSQISRLPGTVHKYPYEASLAMHGVDVEVVQLGLGHWARARHMLGADSVPCPSQPHCVLSSGAVRSSSGRCSASP